jgi:hypothetical protein
MAATREGEIGVSSDPGVGWLTETARQFSDEADELRATTDRAAKALSALATAGLSAVGIAKVGDLFPDPGDLLWPWLLFLWLGFSLMVVAIIAFVYRFWRANRPLALSTRLAAMRCKPAKMRLPRRAPHSNGEVAAASSVAEYKTRDGDDPDIGEATPLITDVDEDECNEIAAIYGDAMSHAAFADNKKETLAHYEWRADKLERLAVTALDAANSTRLLAQVEHMRAEIEKAKQRAKLVVVRRRMNHVFNRPIAAIVALMFVIGLVMFATAADRFDSAHAKNAPAAAEQDDK